MPATESPVKPEIGSRLAHAVRALHQAKADKSEAMKDFNAAIERLENEVASLSDDILTGQGSLPLADA